MGKISRLLNSISINSTLKLKNRIVMAPLTRGRSGSDRTPNALMADYYSQRASAGLIISEATVISKQGTGWLNSPGIYNKEQVEGWKKVVNDIHEKDGKIFLQLWHCGRASHSDFHDGKLPVAPSAIKLNGEYIQTPKGKKDYETPSALSIKQITKIIDDYKKAAAHAMEAGFDGVEIHGANGYLIDQFLQTKTNERKDNYGGSISNRYRFLDEVLRGVMEEVSVDRIAVRLSPNGIFNDMGSTDFREQFTFVIEQLSNFSLAYLHVMDGLAFGFHEQGEAMTLADFRKVFKGTLMGNCGYTLETAEQAINNQYADLIAFGRPFISNPDLVERFTNDWPLSEEGSVEIWYASTEEGYIDFPEYQKKS
jgi:2,4-dienoyl-CoA reductase-like NADH-dependent reductase (Old Yellow Enzyme family)